MNERDIKTKSFPMKLAKPRWIGFKVREQYANSTPYWMQHLEGPFTDNELFINRLSDLKDCVQAGGVKDINVLIRE